MGLLFAGSLLAWFGLRTSYRSDALVAVLGAAGALTLTYVGSFLFYFINAPLSIVRELHGGWEAAVSEQRLIGEGALVEARNDHERDLQIERMAKEKVTMLNIEFQAELERLRKEAAIIAPIEACARRLRERRLVFEGGEVTYAEALVAMLPEGVHSLASHEMGLAVSSLRPRFDPRFVGHPQFLRMLETFKSERLLAHTVPVNGREWSVNFEARQVVKWLHDHPV